jgi:putative thioredoxin
MDLGGTQPDVVMDGTDQGFMQDVIETSQTTPVIVDFWAPWCGPCKTLGPMLEKHVRAAKGKVRMVKINIDQHPAVAGQLRVQSIPAVFAFAGGRPVDGFMGAVPESQIKSFVERLQSAGGPNAGLEELLALGEESLSIGDMGGAAQAFAEALQAEPENVKAIAGLAKVYLAAGEPAQAREILATAPESAQSDAGIASVRASLDLMDEGAGAGDPLALQAQLHANPKDHQARYDLARALIGRGDLDGACDALLLIVESNRDWNDGAARVLLLKIFDAAGAGSDLSKSGRRRLSSILFS